MAIIPWNVDQNFNFASPYLAKVVGGTFGTSHAVIMKTKTGDNLSLLKCHDHAFILAAGGCDDPHMELILVGTIHVTSPQFKHGWPIVVEFEYDNLALPIPAVVLN